MRNLDYEDIKDSAVNFNSKATHYRGNEDLGSTGENDGGQSAREYELINKAVMIGSQTIPDCITNSSAACTPNNRGSFRNSMKINRDLINGDILE